MMVIGWHYLESVQLRALRMFCRANALKSIFLFWIFSFSKVIFDNQACHVHYFAVQFG